MNLVKRVLGIVWIILAFIAAYFCVYEFGLPKFATEKQDDLVFGIIIVFVLTPLVALGMGIFGYFSLIGAYDCKSNP